MDLGGFLVLGRFTPPSDVQHITNGRPKALEESWDCSEANLVHFLVVNLDLESVESVAKAKWSCKH